MSTALTMFRTPLSIAGLFLSLSVGQATGGPEVWRPSRGHEEVAIWPGAPPDPQKYSGQDSAASVVNEPVAGRPWVEVGPVSRPTMTVYRPQGRNTGAAVVVFPGGGYQILAIDLEGVEVCDWLTAKGVTCVLLKYRVPGDGASPRSGPYPEALSALQDAQRTVGLVRFNAAAWGVDPHRIGVLGFSAGGHLAAAISTYFGARLYEPRDAADTTSCRPDFAVVLYPGHLSLSAAQWDAQVFRRRLSISSPEQRARAALGLNPDLPVAARTTPTFLLQAQDDHVDNVADAIAYYVALTKAGVPAEMHLYARGGHGFGLRRTNLPITAWTDLVETWMRTNGILSD